MKSIQDVRRERKKGKSVGWLIKEMANQGEKNRDIVDTISNAFGIIYKDLITLDRWNLGEVSVEKIDKYLERVLSRRRIGGFLTPDNTASFFHISINELEAILLQLETNGRIYRIGYPDPNDHFSTIDDVEFEISLFREIEDVVKPQNISPWWWWEPPTTDEEKPWLQEVTKTYDFGEWNYD